MPRVLLSYLLAGSLCASLLGCSGGSTVSGRVTLDGQPLTKGDVAFSPKGEGPVATGKIDSSGRYSLRVGDSPKVPAGNYRVTVVAVEPVDPTPEHPEPLPKVLTPPRYNDPSTSGLEKEVKAGANTIDLELKTMP